MEKIKIKIYNLLRKSEKYFKTDMVYIAKGGSWLMLSRIVSSTSAFLLAIAFANLLPKETYGSYQYILSIASLLAIPTLGGMNTALARAVAQGFDGSIIPALKTRIRWGLLGGLTSLILVGYYYLNGNSFLTIAFLITAIFMPIMDPLGIYGGLLLGKKLFKTSTIYSIFAQTTRAVILISTIYLTKNVVLIIFVYYITNTLLRFTLLKYTLKKIQRNDKIASDTLSYGKHLSLMGVIGAISMQIDKILMWHFFGPASLATYAFALSPISQLRTLLKPVETLATPKLANNDIQIIKKTLPHKMLKMFLLIIPLVALYILTAPYIYKFIFPQYMDSVIYSQFLALTILFFPQKLIGATLTVHARKKALYFISIVNPSIKILGLIILLPIFGLAGAIAAIMVPYAVNTIILTHFFRKI